MREGHACKHVRMGKNQCGNWHFNIYSIILHTEIRAIMKGRARMGAHKCEFRVMTVASVGLLHTSTSRNEIRSWLWVSVSKQCEGWEQNSFYPAGKWQPEIRPQNKATPAHTFNFFSLNAALSSLPTPQHYLRGLVKHVQGFFDVCTAISFCIANWAERLLALTFNVL